MTGRSKEPRSRCGTNDSAVTFEAIFSSVSPAGMLRLLRYTRISDTAELYYNHKIPLWYIQRPTSCEPFPVLLCHKCGFPAGPKKSKFRWVGPHWRNGL
jgi:hypothetical protein